MSLEVKQLRVRRGAELALDGVSFALQSGTLTALVGPNGAGKSTLLHAIEGQIPRESGSIDFDGNPLTPVLVRQKLALMPQRGEIAWHFPITVRELVSLGRLAAKRPGCCDVEAALQRVGLAALAERRLDQLSGGQQQRALLARTLVQPARVLLLDEPCAAIDPPTRSELLKVMGQLRDAGLTLLVTSHDWRALGRWNSPAGASIPRRPAGGQPLLWLVALALLAGPAQPKELQGVEQELVAGGLIPMQVHVVHGAVLQEHGGTTVDAGEVVLIALGRGKEGLSTG